MKKLFIVANWKSNKTESEATEWLQKFQISPAKRDPAPQDNFKYPISNKEIIVCPSFTSLSAFSAEIKNSKLPFKIGVQNISPFDEGAYTGEVNAKQLKEFAEFVLIGHSERRENFKETDEIINKKIEIAVKYGLNPILCISELNLIQKSKVKIQNFNSKFKSEGKQFIIAYEPLFAIGSGSPDTPENANNIAKQIKQELGDVYVLYGGSVKSDNVRSFTEKQNIDGVLVGNTSLDPVEFSKIIENA